MTLPFYLATTASPADTNTALGYIVKKRKSACEKNGSSSGIFLKASRAIQRQYRDHDFLDLKPRLRVLRVF